ncbi:MAG: hypothetical protein AAF628_27515 [Planctomycetota bacterium]
MSRTNVRLLEALPLALLALVTSCQSVEETGDRRGPADATFAELERSLSREPRDASFVEPETERSSLTLPTGNVNTSAVTLEKIAPSVASPGQEFEYTLEVTNLTENSLDEVVVTDSVPGNLRLESSEPPFEMRDDGVARWALGALPAHGRQSIRVIGRVVGAGDVTSCSTVDYVARVCTTIRVVEPMLEIVKSAPANALLCEQIPVEYVVTNSGTGIARDLRLIDDLAAELNAIDGRPIEFAIDALGPGESRVFSAMLRADAPGVFTSAASVGGEGMRVQSASTETVVRAPRLRLDAEGPARSILGREVTYSFAVVNDGDAVAAGARVSAWVPAGTSLVGATMGGQASGGDVVWDLGDVPPASERTVSMTLRPEGNEPIKTTATVDAQCAPTVSAQVGTELIGIAAILLEVVDVEDPIMVGDSNTYEIRVTNQGNAPGTGIAITCRLEDTMEFVSATGASDGTCSGLDVTFTPLATLAPRERATWRVMVKAVDEGDVRFGVRLTSDQKKRPVEETEATTFYK